MHEARKLDQIARELGGHRECVLEAEASFRRGFHQGVAATLDEVLRLLRNGKTQAEIEQEAFTIEARIADWRTSDPTKMPAPPL